MKLFINLNKKQFSELLVSLSACSEARQWAVNKTAKQVIKTCHRGDWMLWLYKKLQPNDLQNLTLAKGYCAKTVIHLMKDERSINAVNAAIAFGNGEISRTELNAAADAAADAAYADAAADAAYADAAAAAYAAAAYAAAAYAAYAADAAAAAYAAYARTNNQKDTADICRQYLPFDKIEIN